MNREQYHARLVKIPEPILLVADQNACVHRLKEMFIHGQIITIEEMLAQMVVHLAKDWDDVQRRNYELAMNMNLPITKQ